MLHTTGGRAAVDNLRGNPPPQRHQCLHSGLEAAGAYIDPILAFKRRFQRTKVISAWNEPNHRTQPTRYNNPGARNGEGGPARAAEYTVLVSNYVCRNAVVRCWVAAGDFPQNGVEYRYFTDYRRALRARLARNPCVPARHTGLPPLHRRLQRR